MGADYLTEIVALEDWELTHPLPATAYKVLRKLQWLAHKQGFPERITVPNILLTSLVGCSEDSLIKARNHLIQAGLITYSGQKKKTPAYCLRYFSENHDYNTQMQGLRHGFKQGIEHGMEQGIELGYEQGCKEEEREEEKAEENAVAYMQLCGVKLQGSQYEAIRDFYEQGITDSMLRFACDEAADHGALNFAYIRRIVDGWICSGIKTLEEAKARKERFEAQRAQQARTLRVQQRAEAPAPPQKNAFFSERWSS